MTKFRVIIQPSAPAEIEQAFLWIAEQDSDGSEKRRFRQTGYPSGIEGAKVGLLQ